MRILGVDPGTHRTGVGILEPQGGGYRLIYSGVIKIPGKLPIAGRLERIYRGLVETIGQLRPEVMALEDVFYAKDIRATVRIGEARACAMLAASASGLDVVEYAPTAVKRAVCGNGRASKEQIQRMIKNLFRLHTLPQIDSSDALAVAICHAHQGHTKAVLSRAQIGA